jgi:hypothetical protein
MNKKYDIHLSAYTISNKSIKAFEALGFQRDEFANNTRCEVTAYHGTYRGNEKLPSNKLWDKLCNILEADNEFTGGLEEEEFDANGTVFFDRDDKIKENVSYLPSLTTEQPKPKIYKACDIHINIDLENSNKSSLKYLEILQVASFDKPKDGKIHRIYTITNETVQDGEKTFLILSEYLKSINGLKGKLKLEKTTRFLRIPETAYTLPFTSSESFKKWLTKVELEYV